MESRRRDGEPGKPAVKKTIARNKKALHEYHVLETFEAGIALVGPEVKSIRAGKVSLAEAYARVERGEVWLYNMHISPYDPASRWNADPLRTRKLLLHAREIRKLIGATEQKGLTLVPLELYLFRGYVKVTLALARGKKLHDKRADLKRKAVEREVRRAVSRS
ncbi:MAG TPA: SsrA-binding protein SmpB [Longimicrobiales bacterium]|nr:SsrA-binding protein SmpB [Longimicrobiales bacterium]